jgi:membrane protease YdiL (CAAX protease family)
MGAETVDLRSLTSLMLLTGAVLVLGIWYFSPGQSRGLLEPQRRRVVPWTGIELILALVLVFFVWPNLIAQMVGALFSGAGGDTAEAVAAKKARMQLVTMLLATPFQVFTCPIVFAQMSDTRLYQLGITMHNWLRNLLAGLIGFIAFTPFTYLALGFIVLLIQQVLHAPPEQHPLLENAMKYTSKLDWTLAYLVGCVSAPLVEELIFRGVLQPWFAARRWGGHLAMGLALFLAVEFRGSQIQTAGTKLFHFAQQARNNEQLGEDIVGLAWRNGLLPSFLNELGPMFFVILLTPVYFWLFFWFRHDRSASRVLPAIFGTAVLFAIVHATVWPHPVPLFFLALGLGLAAYRTQSLVPSIVMHALFNTLSFVMLGLQKS